MKIIVLTGYSTDDEGFKVPFLNGYENLVKFSLAELNDRQCIARVAGDGNTITKILQSGITVLTDDEALRIIKKINPLAELEDLDTLDPEIDKIAKKLKINPEKIRKMRQRPTLGRRLLQDQEEELLKVISEKLGLTKDYWDQEAKKEGYRDGKELEDEFKRGKNKAHEVILKRILEKIKK